MNSIQISEILGALIACVAVLCVARAATEFLTRTLSSPPSAWIARRLPWWQD